MFDDEAFSKSRLKSCFLFSFSSWASLMFDVEHPFVRDISIFPSAGFVGCFVLVFFSSFSLVGFGFLVVYVLYTCKTPKYTLVVFDMFRVFCKPKLTVS